MQTKFEISQSSLEKARNTNDRNWLEATFKIADNIIESGGKINITQQFSDASTELVAIIDSKELLDYYRSKYIRE